MIVRFNGRAPQPQSFRLANQGNNNVDTVQFQLPLFDGAAAFLHLGIGKYSDIVPLNDGVYVATRTHTQHAGRMECWIEILADGDRVWRSDVFVMTVGHIPDAGQRIEQQYPTAIEEALRAVDTLTGVDARAETLPPGSEATVRFEEDAEGNRTIVYGIPRGRNGAGGGEGGGIYFETDETLILDENNVLRVNTATEVQEDNTLPVTSAAVYTTVGNINALLETI